jgi:hypothetical protein
LDRKGFQVSRNRCFPCISENHPAIGELQGAKRSAFAAPHVTRRLVGRERLPTLHANRETESDLFAMKWIGFG